MAEMEEALAWDSQRVADKYLLGGGAGAPPAQFAAELKAAWERVSLLQRKFTDLQGAHAAVVAQHQRAVAQLEETAARLNDERKANLKGAQEHRRLRLELDAKAALEPMLEKAQQDRYALEKDLHELTAKLMHAPAASVVESKALRLQLAEAQRARSGAELRELEARRELERLTGQLADGDGQLLKQERDAARAEVERLRVERDTLREKILVHERMRAPPSYEAAMPAAGGGAPAGSGAVLATAASADGPLTIEQAVAALNDAREHKAATLEELRKLHKELVLSERLTEDLRAELDEVRARLRAVDADKVRKLSMHERELDRRAEKIRKLEAQLKRMLTGDLTTVRSSVDGRASQDLAAGLAPGESVFEVVLAGATLEGPVLGEDDPSTFLTLDFFEHETQATPVVTGLAPTYDMQIQYVVRVDNFFLDYMATQSLKIELNRATGMDFQTLGVALVPLRKAIEDLEAGTSTGRHTMSHFADVVGVGGQLLGTVRFQLKLPAAVLAPWHTYKQLTPPPRLALNAEDPATAARAAADRGPAAAAHIRFTVVRCTGLRPRVGSAATVVPYASFQFPGFPPHDTHFARGVDPVFDDATDFPLARTAALETRLAEARLEISVFDDADVDMEEAGLLGIAKVPLAPLAEGVPLEGAFPLFNRQRECTGQIIVSAAWVAPLAAALPAAGSAPRALPAPPAAAADGAAVATSAVPDGGRRAMSRLRQSRDASASPAAAAAGAPAGEELQPVTAPPARPATSMALEGELLTETSAPPPMGVSREYGLASEATEPEMRVKLKAAPAPATAASRYTTEESLDEERFLAHKQASQRSLAFPVADLPKDWPDAATNVVINIQSAALSSETRHDPNVKNVFVLFEFLPEFVSQSDQRTPSLPNAAGELVYDFTRAFAVDAKGSAAARFQLSQALRGVTSPEAATIPLVIVSESDSGGDDFHEIAYHEINLLDLLEDGRDLINREVEMLDVNKNVAATLTVTVIAYDALRSILADP